jgi:hypothetical protein
MMVTLRDKRRQGEARRRGMPRRGAVRDCARWNTPMDQEDQLDHSATGGRRHAGNRARGIWGRTNVGLTDGRREGRHDAGRTSQMDPPALFV